MENTNCMARHLYRAEIANLANVALVGALEDWERMHRPGNQAHLACHTYLVELRLEIHRRLDSCEKGECQCTIH